MTMASNTNNGGSNNDDGVIGSMMLKQRNAIRESVKVNMNKY